MPKFICSLPDYSVTEELAAGTDKDAAEMAASRWCHRNAEFIETYVIVEDDDGNASAFTVEVVARPEFVASSVP